MFGLESDSAARDSDTSDGPSDSIATCLQDGSNSQCTSTEVIGGSGELLSTKESIDPNNSQSKVVMRTKRRNSERPWSVSCLSQLEQQTNKVNRSNEQISNQGLANHSISESALHTMSSPSNAQNSPSAAATNGSSMKSLESKNSLKRRRMRTRKRLGVNYNYLNHIKY